MVSAKHSYSGFDIKVLSGSNCWPVCLAPPEATPGTGEPRHVVTDGRMFIILFPVTRLVSYAFEISIKLFRFVHDFRARHSPI